MQDSAARLLAPALQSAPHAGGAQVFSSVAGLGGMAAAAGWHPPPLAAPRPPAPPPHPMPLFPVAQVGEFGGDNRAGIDKTLHRISCIRNRAGRVVGLTCRVGRAILGSAAMVDDLIRRNASILMLGGLAGMVVLGGRGRGWCCAARCFGTRVAALAGPAGRTIGRCCALPVLGVGAKGGAMAAPERGQRGRQAGGGRLALILVMYRLLRSCPAQAAARHSGLLHFASSAASHPPRVPAPGRPGVGKTTAIREISRKLADEWQKRVVIVDTSNEIGGDGDIPHPGIGGARRMQVGSGLPPPGAAAAQLGPESCHIARHAHSTASKTPPVGLQPVAQPCRPLVNSPHPQFLNTPHPSTPPPAGAPPRPAAPRDD